MELSMIDWGSKSLNLLQIMILMVWCSFVLDITLATHESKKKKIRKSAIVMILVILCTLIASIAMDILDYSTGDFMWEEGSVWNVMISCLYVIYNTLYTLVPTLFCFMAGRWMYTQDRSIKTFTAVLIGLIGIIIKEFVYQCMLLPCYQVGEDEFLKELPNTWIAFVVEAVCLYILYLIYRSIICKRIKGILNTPDGRMDRFVKIPLYSNIIFAALIAILQTFGISIAAVRWADAMIFFMACSCLTIVYLMMYWSIFTGITLSTQRMKDQAELDVACTIQSSVLPNTFPPFPQHHEFSIYASMDTAKEVGGDFYDFYFVNERELIITIADVSGKGIPASLFMMTTRTLLKSLTMSGIPLEEAMYKANNSLCEHNDADMFVTVWIAKIDIYNGHMEFVNAGHNPPLLKKEHGDASYLDHRQYHRGLMLGARVNISYRRNERDLCVGDMLYLYTDGVSEANNTKGELYGEQRLQEYLNSYKGTDPKELLNQVSDHVAEFVNGADQFDDITMLGLSIHTLPEVLGVSVSQAEMSTVTKFVEQSLMNFGCEQTLIHHALVSVDEIFSNIIKYSNATQATIRCSPSDSKIKISFADNGIPYNPLSAKDPEDINADLSQRKIGGLGIHVVKQIMDAMEYSYQDGNNVLTISKDKLS